jgi:hypothetical protein
MSHVRWAGGRASGHPVAQPLDKTRNRSPAVPLLGTCHPQRNDFHTHVAHCWENPVKQGLVARPADWPYSSIHREIHAGRIAQDWSGRLIEGAVGERRTPDNGQLRTCGKQGCRAGTCCPPHTRRSQASHALSPAASLTRVGRPMRSRMRKNGTGSSSSTFTMVPASHVPSAISMAAATGGTPAV